MALNWKSLDLDERPNFKTSVGQGKEQIPLEAKITFRLNSFELLSLSLHRHNSKDEDE